MIAEELETVVMLLPLAERARLAERLIASLDEDEEVDRAWATEIERRLEAFRAGEMAPIAADDVFLKAHARLR